MLVRAEHMPPAIISPLEVSMPPLELRQYATPMPLLVIISMSRYAMPRRHRRCCRCHAAY